MTMEKAEMQSCSDHYIAINSRLFTVSRDSRIRPNWCILV